MSTRLRLSAGETESFPQRLSGSERNPRGRVRTPTALSRTREFGWQTRIREIPRNVEENAHGRERLLSAVRVNPCAGSFAEKVKGSPSETRTNDLLVNGYPKNKGQSYVIDH